MLSDGRTHNRPVIVNKLLVRHCSHQKRVLKPLFLLSDWSSCVRFSAFEIEALIILDLATFVENAGQMMTF